MSAGLLAKGGASVPTISRFFGIRVTMYVEDHPPPHFHVEYGGAWAKVGIDSLELLAGSLPRRVAALVLEWAMMHRPELRENWRRCERHELPLLRIAGLDEEG
jgi:hypothetical protein